MLKSFCKHWLWATKREKYSPQNCSCNYIQDVYDRMHHTKQSLQNLRAEITAFKMPTRIFMVMCLSEQNEALWKTARTGRFSLGFVLC